MKKKAKTGIAILLSMIAAINIVNAQESKSPPASVPKQDAREVANKLANPVATIYSVPFQFNLNVRVSTKTNLF